MVGDDAKLIIPEYDNGNNSGGVHEEAPGARPVNTSCRASGGCHRRATLLPLAVLVRETRHARIQEFAKTSKALAALPLMRAGLPLPKYRSNAEFFSFLAHAGAVPTRPAASPDRCGCVLSAAAKGGECHGDGRRGPTTRPKERACASPRTPQRIVFGAMPEEPDFSISARRARPRRPSGQASRNPR